MILLKRLTLPIVGFAIVLVAVASVTLSVGQAQSTQQPVTADQALQAAVVAQVAGAANHMTDAGYHDLDESIERGEIPPGALRRVTWARIGVGATQWPEPLRASAQQLVEHSLRVEEALATEDPTVAGTPVHELHEVADAFIADAYDWLVSAAGGNGRP